MSVKVTFQKMLNWKKKKKIKNASKADSATKGKFEDLFKANQGLKVTPAGFLFTRFFLLIRNVALCVADHARILFKKIFMDSVGSKELALRTKKNLYCK